MSDMEEKNGLPWIYIFRQLFISSGAWSCYFMAGLFIGSPTVLIPQLRKEHNSTEVVSPEMASWLPAVFTYSGIPWLFILSILVTYIGRKKTYSIVSISSFIGFIIFYCSNNIYQILISAIFQAAVAACNMTITVIIITEYTSSKYRGVFLTIKSATFFWGILASNTIGTFFHWKNIPVFGLMCSVYNLITVFFWPESPLWLAQKRRFDQCAKSHRWLKGSQKDAEIELEKLIADHQNVKRKIPLKFQLINNFKVMVKKQFYKPVLFSILLTALYNFSGKLVCTVYAIDILKKITNSESAAYAGMLILDGVTVTTMYIGCAIAKSFKRRTLLISSSSIAVTFMYLLSLYLYLVSLKIITEDKHLSMVLLVGYSVAISCGPMILSTSIVGELISLESRSLSVFVIGFICQFFYGTVLKVSPYFFKTLKMHGTFLLFALSSSVCLVLIYYYLPETKDKTLKEISDCIKGVKPVEEAKELLPVRSNNISIVRNKTSIEK